MYIRLKVCVCVYIYVCVYNIIKRTVLTLPCNLLLHRRYIADGNTALEGGPRSVAGGWRGVIRSQDQEHNAREPSQGFGGPAGGRQRPPLSRKLGKSGVTPVWHTTVDCMVVVYYVWWLYGCCMVVVWWLYGGLLLYTACSKLLTLNESNA